MKNMLLNVKNSGVQYRRVGLRLAAACLGLCGAFSALHGAGSTANGYFECPAPFTLFPAKCTHAYVGPPATSGVTLTCDQYYYFWCEPTSGSVCGTFGDWGQQVSGRCDHFLDEANQTYCTENGALPTLRVRFYQSECRFTGCACSCVWITEGQPGLDWVACDCYQGNPGT